jgi:hypothetical protein
LLRHRRLNQNRRRSFVQQIKVSDAANRILCFQSHKKLQNSVSVKTRAKVKMSGIEQEIAERGYSEGVNAVVRELLLSGYPIEEIARVSRLPVEEIIAMKEALKKDGQDLAQKQ